jgi:outer membrane protein
MRFKRFPAAVVCMALATASLSANAYEKGDFLLRFGAAHVNPHDDSDELEGPNGDINNTGVGVDSDTQLGLTFTYMLTDAWALELLASTPFTHDIDGEGSTLDGLGLGGRIGEVKHLPPTLMAQYYFNNESRVTPYLGAGVNYTIMLEDDLSGTAERILQTDDLDLDNSVGLAVQFGFDVEINENLFFNASVWHIDLDTEADIDDSVLGDLEVDVDVDPWVYMIGLGYKF